MPLNKVTVPEIRESKNQRILTMSTAYDFTMASLLDGTSLDMILVGDSLANCIQGEPTTLPVTLDEMIYHCKCVQRGVSRALVIGDLPFLSYQVDISGAIQSAGRLIKEGRVSAVKLEGGVAVAETIRRLTDVDIPVMGHVGLTPQSYHRMGGHRIQGKSHGTTSEVGTFERILADAHAVEEAGAFAVVLEGIPSDLAAQITRQLTIPTIGIGAGQHCDGQVLVINDLLGLTVGKVPSFAKAYASLSEEVGKAVNLFVTEVRTGKFPAPTRASSKNSALSH